MAQNPSNSGGNLSAPNRAPAAKVIAGALSNSRVAQALIGALGSYSLNAIVANSTSQTLNFGSLQVGNLVLHIPAGSASASPLGNAAGYAALGASAVTGSTGGGSTLNGNLGIYPSYSSSITNFPPSTYSGVENAGNSAAQSAQSDAAAYFNNESAVAIASGSSISATLDGQTLVPGVYKTGAGSLAASGAGALTFNGAGTYVIYTSSTLTTGAGGVATMNLTNGASAANIFWLVGSSATINSGSAGVFQGNVLAEDSITVTAGGTVNGSLIALTAAVTLSATTVVNAESSGPSGSVSFSTVAVAGNLGYPAVVGDMYLALQLINLDANNPILPVGGALTGRVTGDGGLEF